MTLTEDVWIILNISGFSIIILSVKDSPYKSENFQDLRFADGTLISKNQMPIVSHSAVEHVIEDDVVVDISNIANTEEVDDDTWETILNQDILNVR